jgi:hypothetical protein
MRSLIDIFANEIIGKIDKVFRITRVEFADVITTKLFVCSTKWLKVGDFVRDEENRGVTITDVGEGWIVVRKESPFVWDSKTFISVKDFIFFAGTPLDVNSEWLKSSIIQTNKLPLFWLPLPTNETFNLNGQGLERESSIRLFIIEQSELKYTVEEYYFYVMKYLYTYLDAMKDAIKKNKLFANIESFEQREFYRLGSESADGFEAVILDSNLSAIEIRFTLPIRKRGCEC